MMPYHTYGDRSSLIPDTHSKTCLLCANYRSRNGAGAVFHKLERPQHDNQVAENPFLGGSTDLRRLEGI